MSKDINELFVYGTLQSDQSRSHVLDGLDYIEATLHGYEKLISQKMGYPIIVKSDDEDAKVEGEVYFELTPKHWKRIDSIEGEGSLYHRIKVAVKDKTGEKITCYTYYPSEGLIKNFKEELFK